MDIMKFSTLVLALFITVMGYKGQEEVSAKSIIQTHKNSAQYFEGIIKYNFLMEDVRELSNEEIEAQMKQMEAFMGRYITYYVKGSKVVSEIKGPMLKTSFYQDETDSLYIYDPDINELNKISMYDGWNYTYDTIITSKNAKVINGIECDLISFKSDQYTWDYYYNNEKLKVNPEYFKHYQSNFWNKAIEISNSLPMRFEGKTPGSYIYMEVEEILEQALDDSVFEIPKK